MKNLMKTAIVTAAIVLSAPATAGWFGYSDLDTAIAHSENMRLNFYGVKEGMQIRHCEPYLKIRGKKAKISREQKFVGEMPVIEMSITDSYGNGMGLYTTMDSNVPFAVGKIRGGESLSFVEDPTIGQFFLNLCRKEMGEKNFNSYINREGE